MTRKDMRTAIFILLYQQSFGHSEPSIIIQTHLDKNNIRRPKEITYISEMFFGALEKIEEIDEIISEYSKDWQIDRMSKVTLALLRLAIYEIIYVKDVPITITNDTITGLAAKYDSSESANFVNGILGKIQEKLEINE